MPEVEAEEEVDEDGNPVAKKAPKEEKNYAEEPVDPTMPINAVVRVRIPKQQPEPEMDDEGNPIPMNFNEDDLDEIPFEDKCASIDTVIQQQRIWAINQQVDRAVRNDLALEMRSIVDRLEAIDQHEFLVSVEEEAVRFENAFLKLFEDSPNNDSNAPKVPVFDFKPLL